MIQIRSGVFETNSSSTHSICISTDNTDEMDFPEALHFRLDEFGWEWNRLDTVESKAAYLYAALIDTCKQDELAEKTAWIMDTLAKHGVECVFDIPNRGYYRYRVGIDHGYNLADFVKAVMHSERRLLRYLFSPNSFVLTGNDNDDEGSVHIEVNYPHETYYKGN